MPTSVIDMRSLLTWLRTRGGNWERLLVEQAVRVTVNKQFAAPETAVNDAAEIAIISMRPG